MGPKIQHGIHQVCHNFLPLGRPFLALVDLKNACPQFPSALEIPLLCCGPSALPVCGPAVQPFESEVFCTSGFYQGHSHCGISRQSPAETVSIASGKQSSPACPNLAQVRLGPEPLEISTRTDLLLAISRSNSRHSSS